MFACFIELKIEKYDWTYDDVRWWYVDRRIGCGWVDVWNNRVHLCFDRLLLMNSLETHTVYPKKYAHGFVVLCFVVVMQSFIMNSHEVFIHIHQGCFAGTGAIFRLPQCQWNKPDGYGKISQCITTTKHNKAKTVCIFLGIYCTSSHLPPLSKLQCYYAFHFIFVVVSCIFVKSQVVVYSLCRSTLSLSFALSLRWIMRLCRRTYMVPQWHANAVLIIARFMGMHRSQRVVHVLVLCDAMELKRSFCDVYDAFVFIENWNVSMKLLLCNQWSMRLYSKIQSNMIGGRCGVNWLPRMRHKHCGRH